MKYFALLSLASIAFALPQAGTPGNGTTGGSCDTAKSIKVAQLMSGIQSNLLIQMQELQGVKTLQTLVKANTTMKAVSGPSNFELSRASLLKIQQSGVDIRATNQKIAAELKSPSEKGLATVAMAQTQEIDQVKSLQGGGANDEKTLAMLVTEVEGGTKQNMMNLQAAQSQCGK